MVQVVRPIAQYVNIGGGGWSAVGAATTWEATDEAIASPNDSDYVQAGDAAALLVLRVGVATNPGDDLNHSIFIRARIQGVSGPANLTVALYDNIDAAPNVIGAWVQPITTSWTDYQIAVGVVEGNAITDYANLGVGLMFSGFTSGATVQVSVVEMRIPDPLDARSSRVAIEVMAKSSVPEYRSSRIAIEVMGPSGLSVRTSRIALEVMAKSAGAVPGVPATRASRVALEVMAKRSTATTPATRSSRLTAEVMARTDLHATVVPLPVPADVAPIFLANWIEAVQVATTWTTAVATSEDVRRDERMSLLSRPLRTVDVMLTGLNPDETRSLLRHSWSRSGVRQPFPIYSDHAAILAVPSATEIECETAMRRFFVGARVAVVAFEDNRPVSPQYGIVEEVNADGLVLQAPGVSAAPGGRVYPCIDAEVSLEPGAIEYQGLSAGALRVTATEVSGQSTLPGLTRVGGPMSYRGLPILLPPIDWREPPAMAVLREGDTFEVGVGRVVYARGQGARMSFDLNCQGLSRAAIWPTLRLFDSRRGRARRVWAINPGALLDVVTVGSSYVLASVSENHAAVGQLAERVRFLGIVYADGTADVREITTLLELESGGADFWRFELAAPIDATRTVQRVAFAHLGAFSHDLIRERWTVQEQCAVRISFLEAAG